MICISIQLNAKEITSSIAKKISPKLPNMEIIGKNNEGIIVRKYGSSKEMLEAYDDKMKIRWVKYLDDKGPYITIRKITLTPENIFVFYESRKNTGVQLLIEQYDASLSKLLDTKYADTLLNYNEAGKYKIISSIDNSYHLCYFNTNKFISATLIDNTLSTVWKKQILFPLDANQARLEEVLISNKAEGYFIFKNFIDKKEWIIRSFEIVSFSKEKNNIRTYIDLDHKLINASFTLDNKNRYLYGCGFYSLPNNNIAGIMYTNINLDSMIISAPVYSTFSDISVNNILKQNIYQEKKVIPKIRNLIPNYNGSLTIITELFYTKTKTTTLPNLYGYYQSTTSKFFNYNDIIVSYIDSNGHINWQSVLSKKQVSENDKGINSSFTLVNRSNQLEIIYNREISSSTYVVTTNLLPEGRVYKSNLFDNIQQNTFLAPRLSKQIGKDEVVIPSIYRNFLKLIKIKY